MVFTIIILFLTISCLKVSTYDHLYQAKWFDNYEMCGGSRQSPIELNSREAYGNLGCGFVDAQKARLDNNMSCVQFNNFNLLHSKPAIVYNNGHTVNMGIPKLYDSSSDSRLWTLFDEVSPHITGGPFGKNKYVTESIHFHWGSKNNHGSEHVVDGHRYSMEMHIVHRNAKYKNMNCALNKPDGLAVLGVLYKAKEEFKDYCGLGNVLEALQYSTHFNTTSQMGPFSLASLLVNLNAHNFFTYDGSLTTPPCFETVKWVVFSEPIEMSENQMSIFRSVHNEHGGLLMNNYRELQMKNCRQVVFRHVKDKPMSSTELHRYYNYASLYLKD